MALTGIEIFKLLPRTNCKDCGKPTCLAFAMGLAQKKAQLDECPHASDECKAALEGASAPPIRKFQIGVGDDALTVGGETVMFRHDEKFHQPAGIAIRVQDDLDDAALTERLEQIKALEFERVGQHIAVDLVAVEATDSDAAKFAAVVGKVSEAVRFPLVLKTTSPEVMKAGLEVCKGQRPLLYGADESNADAMAALAKEAGCPLVVSAAGLDALAELTGKVKGAGVEDLVLDSQPGGLRAGIQDLTTARRAALKKSFRPLGYPTIASAVDEDPMYETAKAAAYVAKYASIVIMDQTGPEAVLPVLTTRQNIYTDPQKPIQVEPGLYEVGQVDESSPLMFTTNFSLTYFTVEGDVESSRVPSYILAVDTEGTSVLTAYSGDKLNEKTVAEAMTKAGVEEKLKHKKLIIPGHVAVLSGKLEEATGWEILVGPKESAYIPKFLQQVWT